MNRTQAPGSGWACGRAAVAIRQVRPEQDLPALSDFFTPAVIDRDEVVEFLADIAASADT